jgi:hypothetical protein
MQGCRQQRHEYSQNAERPGANEGTQGALQQHNSADALLLLCSLLSRSSSFLRRSSSFLRWRGSSLLRRSGFGWSFGGGLLGWSLHGIYPYRAPFAVRVSVEFALANNGSDIASDLPALFLGFSTFGKQIFPVTPIEKVDR